MAANLRRRLKVLVTVLQWARWQLFVLLFASLIYINLFGEHGRYHHPVADIVAGVALLGFALTAGTVIPFRRWRARDE